MINIIKTELTNVENILGGNKMIKKIDGYYYCDICEWKGNEQEVFIKENYNLKNPKGYDEWFEFICPKCGHLLVYKHKN